MKAENWWLLWKWWFCSGFSTLDSELVVQREKDRNQYNITLYDVHYHGGSNDFEYETVFERQIEALKHHIGLVIGLSTSGKSKNVVNALSKGRC